MATWYHYVGGYSSAHGFIAEARELGASRAVSPAMARKMAWGDRVILLKCIARDSTSALVLGEFRVTRVTLDESLASEVGAALLAEGRAHFEGGGGQVVTRACGSYVVCGTWAVNADVSEIVDIAERAAVEKGVDCKVLIAGPLIRVYHPPHAIDGAPQFNRGFVRTEDDQAFILDDPRAWVEEVGAAQAPDSEVMAVRGYQKRKRRVRRDTYTQKTLF